MAATSSQQLIVGSLSATAVVAAGSALADGSMPGFRMAVGFAFAGVGLATCNMFAPDLAGSLAVLMLTTTVIVYGGPLMDTVTTLTTAPTTPAGGTTDSAAPATPTPNTGKVAV